MFLPFLSRFLNFQSRFRRAINKVQKTRSRFMKMQSLKFLTILAVASAIVALGALAKSPESPQRVNDFKITERMTVLGQSFDITTMIKGARERSERHQKIASMPAGDRKSTRLNSSH